MTRMTAAEILAIRTTDARTVFPGGPAAVAARFRDLAMAWHPDRNPGADPAVLAHLIDLHRAARAPVAARPERIFETTDGRVFRFAFSARHETDAGEVLVGERHVAHVVPDGMRDLAARADAFVPAFADDAMRAEMARFLPRRTATLDCAAAIVFVEAKRTDEVLLRDLLKLAPFDPRHAAWIATRLVNLACWLQWAGIAHGAIGPDSLLVSTSAHSVALTGPFLTSARFGRSFDALPERTLSCCPRLASAGAASDDRIDPELVRLTLRECLGDAAGTRLAADATFPKPFANWLLMPAKGAQADFPAWEKARGASFGARRFVQWDLDPAALMAA